MLDKISTSTFLDNLKIRLGIKSDLELARWIGVGQSTVSAWRTRGTSPFDAIVRAAMRHGISLDYLLLDQTSPLPWRIPEVIYFQDGEPHHLDAMSENVPLATAVNPNFPGFADLQLELMLVTDDEYPPIEYGSEVIIRRMDMTDPINERGYYYMVEEQEGRHRGCIVEIIPKLPRGTATIIYKDKPERNITGRSAFDGIYGQILAALKPLSQLALR